MVREKIITMIQEKKIDGSLIYFIYILYIWVPIFISNLIDLQAWACRIKIPH